MKTMILLNKILSQINFADFLAVLVYMIIVAFIFVILYYITRTEDYIKNKFIVLFIVFIVAVKAIDILVPNIVTFNLFYFGIIVVFGYIILENLDFMINDNTNHQSFWFKLFSFLVFIAVYVGIGFNNVSNEHQKLNENLSNIEQKLDERYNKINYIIIELDELEEHEPDLYQEIHDTYSRYLEMKESDFDDISLLIEADYQSKVLFSKILEAVETNSSINETERYRTIKRELTFNEYNTNSSIYSYNKTLEKYNENYNQFPRIIFSNLSNRRTYIKYTYDEDISNLT